CIQIEQQRLLPDRFLTPSDFHHSHNRLNKRRTKLHCSEISRKLFPEYHDRISTERTCSNGTFDGKIGASLGNRVDLFVELTRECEAWQKINRRLSSISNLRKPVFNATCAVSDFYANWAV
ncbi:hypothetical protein T12_4785, partial [Trichinella patagoniensis]